MLFMNLENCHIFSYTFLLITVINDIFKKCQIFWHLILVISKGSMLNSQYSTLVGHSMQTTGLKHLVTHVHTTFCLSIT